MPQPVPFDGFDALALAPDEQRLYGLGYTRDGAALAVLQAADGTLGALLPGGEPYGGLAIAADGTRMLTLGSFGCTGGVAMIDATLPAIESALPLGSSGDGRRLALSPDSRRLWVATPDGLTVIDPERFAVIERRFLADGALDVALGCRPADCPPVPTAVPRTPPALVPTATPTPRPPTPTDTPTRPPEEPPDVVIAVGSSRGAPGDRVELAVSLRQEFGTFIAGVQVDLDFDPVVAPAPWLEQRPDCAIDLGLERREAAFELLPPGCVLGESCRRMRALRTNHYEVAGVQVDVGFGRHAAVVAVANGQPHCRVDPAIDKPGTAYAFQPPLCTPGVDCTGIRAIVLGLDNVDPIADGARLFECAFEIAADAPSGWIELPLENVGGGDGTGNPVSTVGAAGGIFVTAVGMSPSAPPTPTPASAQRPIEGPSSRTSSGCQVGSPANPGVGLLLRPAALFARRRRPENAQNRASGAGARRDMRIA